MSRIPRLAPVACLLMAALCLPVLAADGPKPKPKPDDPPPADSVGPDIDPDAFIKQRTGDVILPGRFRGAASALYAIHDVWVYTEDEAILNAEVGPQLPRFYKPTWAELFDSIARQTQSSWAWNEKLRQWKFSRPAKPPPFSIEVADGWRSEQRAGYVWFAPADAPVGMDVYLFGSYSSDPKNPDPQLHDKVRDAFAERFAKPFRKDVKAADMETVEVAGAKARYFETPTPRPGAVWRQWAFVADGHAFVIVSALDEGRQKELLPDVRAMVKSFKVVADGEAPKDEPPERK